MAWSYGNSSTKRKRAISKCRDRHDLCAICWHPIDYSLPSGDPMCFESDDIIPVSKGGDGCDPMNQQAAHRCCNQWRGNRPMSYVDAVMSGEVEPHTPPPMWRTNEAPKKKAIVRPTLDWL